MMVEDRGGLGLAELQRAAPALLAGGPTRSRACSGLATTFSARSPQVYLDIDRTMAESLRSRRPTSSRRSRPTSGSTYVNLFNKFNQSFQVRIQADSAYRRRPTTCGSCTSATRAADGAARNALIDVKRVLGAELVTRYNLYPAAAGLRLAAPGFSSGQALGVMEQLAAERCPQGMAYDWTASSYQEQQVGNQAYFIFALSIVLVYLVLAALYESWSLPPRSSSSCRWRSSASSWRSSSAASPSTCTRRSASC